MRENSEVSGFNCLVVRRSEVDRDYQEHRPKKISGSGQVAWMRRLVA
ncbi:hypothetical protein D1AOALGA4SA_9160 [Olavius algarvensis Delta 1 endosymbiont]|nr:hypothetical protein D1AOALGA4SA_9160 [Olavius algarvensis Delta 1 endosymbiont]